MLKADKYFTAGDLNDPEIKLKLYRSSDVDSVDAVLQLTKGYPGPIAKESHWKALEALIDFYFRKWPQEANDFFKQMVEIKRTRLNSKGESASKEIKFLAALPPTLHRLLRAAFPLQEMNKDFMYKLTRRFKKFRVGE